ncbi:LysR family transcriptional regulator [Clostridium estertheticum]|uniref:LysR family transcriptional regulator n=1 Tax=Clostridium estertheticum TaxID=238834 RepID=UPI001C7CECA3|nr:LysR family transcriptional regulator [Clostridium estertheticum]MBX4270058.1 LysR family transcriptional regulator [Clostridium estertheticum]WLC80262.1 LysR family transcriptional regulator [Clostridium estertheticum]
MDLQLFKTFLTILEVGNYSNSANKLGYAQSTITSQIQALEKEYGGVKLLQRKGNMMLPTESGKVLQQYALRLLEIYEQSQAELVTDRQLTLRIGTIRSLTEEYLPIIIPELKQFYPESNIQLYNGNQTIMYTMLQNNQLDMIFIIDTKHKFGSFTVKVIRKEELVITTPINHPLAKNKTVCYEDIKDEKLILTENGCTYRRFLIKEFQKNKHAPQIAMESASIETLKSAITNHWGIGFLPSFLVKESDGLVPIPLESNTASPYSQIVYAESATCTHRVMKSLINAINLFYKGSIGSKRPYKSGT